MMKETDAEGIRKSFTDVSRRLKALEKPREQMSHAEWVESVEQRFSAMQANFDEMDIAISILSRKLAPTEEGLSILDKPNQPLTLGLAKCDEQPPEGTDYLVTFALPATMNISTYLDKCKEEYYKARGPSQPQKVRIEDCKRTSAELLGLFDQWMVFALTLGHMNKEGLKYMRDTVIGLQEVMDEAVDDMTKPA